MEENKEEQIHEEFEVNKEQKSLDEYDCLLINLSPIKGHLCLSEDTLFFVPEDKSKENNIKINMDEMTHLNLKDENLNIKLKNIKQTYSFSFKEVNNVYNKIKLKCKLNSLSESGDIDNDDVTKSTYSSNKLSCSSNNVSSKNIFNTEKKKVKELKELNENKIIRYNSSKSCLSKSIVKLLEEKKEVEKPIIKENIKFNKLNPDIDHELQIKVINLPPKKLFEKYLSQKNEETSYEAYYKWSGEYSEIKIKDWEKIENKDNKDIEKYQRKENFCIALTGVPLINKSYVNKTMEYYVDEDGTYYLNSISLSSGVPLSDKFNVETHAEFHPYMNNTKTVYRTYVRTNILKWNLFKFALISQGKKNYIQEIDKWIKFIEEKGDKVEDYCA